MIILDTKNYELEIDNKIYELSPIPFKFLLLLSNNTVITTRQFANIVYDIDLDNEYDYKCFHVAIAVQISRLRKKYRFNYKST